MRRLALVIFFLAWLVAGQVIRAGGDGDFRLADPSGDDYGPGTYIYPKNRAFEPYRGLFDLQSFAVTTGIKDVHLDLTLADLRNPWSAPEGFSHQLIEIYLCRGKGTGWVEPLTAGSFVRFSQAWDAILKIAPWESSVLIQQGADGEPIKQPLEVGLAGRQTIRATVPVAVLGEPARFWRYYVLVGSYDGFGEDNFRPVMAEAGEWHFGGGRDDAAEPQVIDLLAPSRGRFCQERQLGSYLPSQKKLALLTPVGPGYVPGAGGVPWSAAAVLAGLLVLVAWWYWYAPAGWREKVAAVAGETWRSVRGRMKRTS